MNKRYFFAAPLLVGSLLLGGLVLWQREVQTWVSIEAPVVREWSTSYVKPPLRTKYWTFPPGPETTVHWVGYSYAVNGQSYSGEASNAGVEHGRVTVYYDPDHPAWSTADRTKPSKGAAIGAGLLFLGGLAVVLGGRRGGGDVSPR